MIAMQDLSFHLRKRLAQKYLGRQAIGAIVLSAARKYFGDTSEQINGYVKFDKVFLSMPQHMKIQGFLHKQHLLKEINHKLLKVGYDEPMRQIFFK